MLEKKKWIRGSIYLLLASIAIVIMWVLYNSVIETSFSNEKFEVFEQKIQSNEAHLEKQLIKYSEQNWDDSIQPFSYYSPISVEKTPFRYGIYNEKDSLVFWNSNTAPFPIIYADSIFNAPIKKLANGWYGIKTLDTNGYHFVGLYIIQYQYPYNNTDLENIFHPSYDFNYLGEISVENKGQFTVENTKGEPYFTILPGDEVQSSKYLEFLIIILLFVAFVLVFESLLIVFQFSGIVGIVLNYFTPFILVILRYYSIKHEWLSFLSNLELFRPDIFGVNMYFPSLGDLLINVLVLFYGAILFRKHFKPFPFDVDRSFGWLYRITGIIAHILVYPFGWGIVFLFHKFIENSSINFNIDKLFTLTFYSIMGLLAMGFLLYAYYVYTQFTVRWIHKYVKSKWIYISIISGIGFFFLIIWNHETNESWLAIFWPLIIVATCAYVTIQNNSKYNFGRTVFVIFICSIFTAHQISTNTSAREKKNRILLAEKLSTDEDPLTEIEFDVLEKKLTKSEFMQSTFEVENDFSLSKFETEAKIKYFKKFWDKYEISYSVFDKDSTAFGLYKGVVLRSFNEYTQIIENHGIQSQINRNVYFIPDYYDKISYLIRYLYAPNDTLKGIVFAELRSKKIPEQIGFPTLLLDKGTKIIQELNNYSFARYVDNHLITNIGDYNYKTKNPWSATSNDTSNYVETEDYSHLILPVGTSSTIVLSLQKESWFTQITSFSYIFTFFGVLLLLTIGLRQMPSGLSFESINLTTKIQLLLIGLVFVTLILFGVGASTFIQNQYNEKTENLISQKIHSIQMEINSKLGAQKTLGEKEKDYAESILEKLSKIFVTDINIYQPNGDIMASSRALIFLNGLLADKMHPMAYNAMHLQNNSEYIHKERIGKLEYMSAYIPFYNNEGNLLAYINLQYFAQQNELEDELSEFLVAIINIFVFLLAFSILGAIFVSNWITRPIKILQTSLRKVELGKKNQRIIYEGNDEIGELVKEYNLKVEELAESADKLAQSERESAWREMAKQVAHEIKNPLTPMKLSIQHLLRTFDPKDPEAPERMKRVANSLIDQINALSRIANEFSNFAKMPKASKLEIIDLEQCIANAIELFQDNNSTSIEFNNELGESAKVYADRELIIRVFNNLIKNAIQAIPDETIGKIVIKIENESVEKLLISVKDNGVGITNQQKENIFVPNFTTKSTGTGLGLAMSKNIVESAQGEIWFESEKGEGATFYIRFNKQF